MDNPEHDDYGEPETLSIQSELPARQLTPVQRLSLALIRHSLRTVRRWLRSQDEVDAAAARDALLWLAGRPAPLTCQWCCDALGVPVDRLRTYASKVDPSGRFVRELDNAAALLKGGAA